LIAVVIEIPVYYLHCPALPERTTHWAPNSNSPMGLLSWRALYQLKPFETSA
jgi:hypothetical protein